MASKFFGRQRECRFYTAGYGNKMAASVTGPRAVNELGGPVIPGIGPTALLLCFFNEQESWSCLQKKFIRIRWSIYYNNMVTHLFLVNELENMSIKADSIEL